LVGIVESDLSESSNNNDDNSDVSSSDTTWIDDFEDGNNQTLLGASIGGGYWFGYTDANDGGNSTITPDVTDDFTTGITDNGYEGKGLEVTFSLGDAIEYPYAAVGFNIGEENEYYDLSKMESFEFWAKGSGEVYVCFKTYTTDNTGTWGDMIYDLNPVPSTWTKVSISPSDIVPEPYSDDEKEGYTWSDDGVGNKVTAIHFKAKGPAGDNISLALDNLLLLGITPEDFGVSTKVKNRIERKINIGLMDAAPNPFNPVTNISFNVIPGERASLKVYDAVGNLVKVLFDGVATKSTYNLKWDATDYKGNKVSSGVYFYRLSQNGKVLTKSVIYMK